jgi:hypothetical protein
MKGSQSRCVPWLRWVHLTRARLEPGQREVERAL